MMSFIVDYTKEAGDGTYAITRLEGLLDQAKVEYNKLIEESEKESVSTNTTDDAVVPYLTYWEFCKRFKYADHCAYRQYTWTQSHDLTEITFPDERGLMEYIYFDAGFKDILTKYRQEEYDNTPLCYSVEGKSLLEADYMIVLYANSTYSPIISIIYTKHANCIKVKLINFEFTSNLEDINNKYNTNFSGLSWDAVEDTAEDD